MSSFFFFFGSLSLETSCGAADNAPRRKRRGEARTHYPGLRVKRRALIRPEESEGEGGREIGAANSVVCRQ